MTIREKHSKLYEFCASHHYGCKSCAFRDRKCQEWLGPERDCMEAIEKYYEDLEEIESDFTKEILYTRGILRWS